MVTVKEKFDYDFLYAFKVWINYLLDSLWPSYGRLATTIIFSGPYDAKTEFGSKSLVLFLYSYLFNLHGNNAPTNKSYFYHGKWRLLFPPQVIANKGIT